MGGGDARDEVGGGHALRVEAQVNAVAVAVSDGRVGVGHIRVFVH